MTETSSQNRWEWPKDPPCPELINFFRTQPATRQHLANTLPPRHPHASQRGAILIPQTIHIEMKGRHTTKKQYIRRSI